MILVRTYLLCHSYQFLILFVLLLSFSCREQATKTTDSKKELLSELEASLDILSNVWYPKTIDSTNGGFWSDFDYKWDKVGPQNKMLVSQARHVWTASTLALYYDD